METGKENGMITMQDSLDILFDEKRIDEETYQYHISLLDKYNI